MDHDVVVSKSMNLDGSGDAEHGLNGISGGSKLTAQPLQPHLNDIADVAAAFGHFKAVAPIHLS